MPPVVPAPPTAVEALLRHERWVYLLGPMALALLSWAWLLPASLDMYGSMSGLSKWMMSARWDALFALQIFLMWAVMMAAMMLPSLVPALLLYGGICRSDRNGGSPALRVNAFALGYLAAWAGFSLAATALQWSLTRLEHLNMMMELDNARLSAAALLLAGLFQWTPLKNNCLTRCRSPASFFSEHWRRGAIGGLALGLHYGLFCLGCCWALMLVLFVGGVMNLACIALLTALVLLEKTAPWGRKASRALGLMLVVLGIATLLR